MTKSIALTPLVGLLICMQAGAAGGTYAAAAGGH